MKLVTTLLLLLVSATALADVVMWRAPDKRENLTPLKPEEIGGYELRALNEAGEQIWLQLVPDPKATSYNAPLVLDATVFQICVYDTDGLYSEWVEITPRPEAPGQGWLE